MQNIIELATNEQRYQMIECSGKTYHAKIRESATKMEAWNEFLKKTDGLIY